MKKSQLLAGLIAYDVQKGWKRKRYGDAPLVQQLKAFLATKPGADDTLIRYADFVAYLQAWGLEALVSQAALAGKSLSKNLIRRWRVADNLLQTSGLLQLSVDLWRSVIPRHLNLRSLSRLAQTCRFFFQEYLSIAGPARTQWNRKVSSAITSSSQ